jgi:hypothetical protein
VLGQCGLYRLQPLALGELVTFLGFTGSLSGGPSLYQLPTGRNIDQTTYAEAAHTRENQPHNFA